MKKEIFNVKKYSKELKNVDWETDIRIKLILDLIGKNKRVLDVGCYKGYISKKIKDRDNEVIGVDISKKAIKYAKKEV